MMETESIINGLLYSMLIMNVFELTDHLKWFRRALYSGHQNLVAILYGIVYTVYVHIIWTV